MHLDYLTDHLRLNRARVFRAPLRLLADFNVLTPLGNDQLLDRIRRTLALGPKQDRWLNHHRILLEEERRSTAFVGEVLAKRDPIPEPVLDLGLCLDRSADEGF